MSEELPVALPKNLFRNSIDLPETALALLDDPGIIDSMISSSELPRDTESCHALLQTQTATIASHVATIASQNQKLEDLTIEMEKLRKLVTRLLKGNHSERQILPAENQSLLPFESSEEFQAARAEAEAEAEAIVQTYTVTRTVNNKKKRDESLPSHLPRVEKIIEGTAAQMNCPEHGKRQPIGFDTTETLVYKPAELYVEVRKYFKYACLSHPECGVASPERPTSLVEGDRYGTSVATAVVVAKWFLHMPLYREQDVFAGSGWTPSRSTLANLASRVDFVAMPLVEHMTRLVQHDIGVGIDDTSCRMLFPRSRRRRLRATRRASDWRRRWPNPGPRATRVFWRRCGPTWDSTRRHTTSSTSASRGTATGPTTSFAIAGASFREIVSRAT
jgi:transposase